MKAIVFVVVTLFSLALGCQRYDPSPTIVSAHATAYNTWLILSNGDIYEASGLCSDTTASRCWRRTGNFFEEIDD